MTKNRAFSELLREQISEDVLKNTNKPRFCYMGYAPPLCIGDEFEKNLSPKTHSSSAPLLVSAPCALFARSSHLCVGDPYIHAIAVSKPVPDRPVFKPAGCTHIDPTVSEYIPPIIPVFKTPPKRKYTGFYVPRSNSLFHPKIEYMSPNSVNLIKTKLQTTPFRSGSSGGMFSTIPASSPLFAKVAAVHKSNDSQPPFRPPGKAVLNNPFPSYIPDPPNSVPKPPSAIDRPAWKASSVSLLSSPTCSIAFNALNLPH